jgi:hypothetical protein
MLNMLLITSGFSGTYSQYPCHYPQTYPHVHRISEFLKLLEISWLGINGGDGEGIKKNLDEGSGSEDVTLR